MAAVDEGRNPYGTPGKGNGKEVWDKLSNVPCPKCGATEKHLKIDKKNNATIQCGRIRNGLESNK